MSVAELCLLLPVLFQLRAKGEVASSLLERMHSLKGMNAGKVSINSRGV